jgi:hypothetical protein
MDYCGGSTERELRLEFGLVDMTALDKTQDTVRENNFGLLSYCILYLLLVTTAVNCNWSGRKNADTIDKLHQAMHPEALNNWHAPFITLCYGFLGPIFGYPGGALVLQSAVLLLWPSVVLFEDHP